MLYDTKKVDGVCAYTESTFRASHWWAIGVYQALSSGPLFPGRFSTENGSKRAGVVDGPCTRLWRKSSRRLLYFSSGGQYKNQHGVQEYRQWVVRASSVETSDPQLSRLGQYLHRVPPGRPSIEPLLHIPLSLSLLCAGHSAFSRSLRCFRNCSALHSTYRVLVSRSPQVLNAIACALPCSKVLVNFLSCSSQRNVYITS